MIEYYIIINMTHLSIKIILEYLLMSADVNVVLVNVTDIVNFFSISRQLYIGPQQVVTLR